MSTAASSPILTVLGVGRIPAGATLASLVGLIVWGCLWYVEPKYAPVSVFCAVLLLSVIAIRPVVGDPKAIVVDEFLGMYTALLFLPEPSLLGAGVLFFAFRLIDLTKPPPFSWIERWKSPFAILLDDIAIGLCLGIAYRLVSG